jgi:hypothetical protein
MRPGGDDLTGHHRADSQLAEQFGGEPSTSLSSWTSSSAASRSQASARRAVDRIAMAVADSSTLRRDESRSPAQVCRSCPSGNVRSRSRRPSGALVTSACRAAMARVRNWTACPRVVSSTWMASRSPRRRGSLRPTPASACRAARTASISSLFTPPRRAGHCGRSTSTIRSQQESSAVVSPAPKLPVPSMAHKVASWRRPKAPH